MKTIYLATDGDYSDYHVIAAFTTREKAEAYCALRNASVEEYEVDPEIDYAPPGMKYWRVTMDRNGKSSDVYQVDCEESKDRLQWQPYGEGDWMLFMCWARDEQHAVKIANERRTFLIAEGLWDKYCGNWRAWWDDYKADKK